MADAMEEKVLAKLDEIRAALERSPFDIQRCGGCGRDVVTPLYELPICNECAKEEARWQ